MTNSEKNDGKTLENGEPLDQASDAINSVLVALFTVFDIEKRVVEITQVFLDAGVNFFKFFGR